MEKIIEDFSSIDAAEIVKSITDNEMEQLALTRYAQFNIVLMTHQLQAIKAMIKNVSADKITELEEKVAESIATVDSLSEKVKEMSADMTRAIQSSEILAKIDIGGIQKFKAEINKPTEEVIEERKVADFTHEEKFIALCIRGFNITNSNGQTFPMYRLANMLYKKVDMPDKVVPNLDAADDLAKKHYYKELYKFIETVKDDPDEKYKFAGIIFNSAAKHLQ